MATSTLTYLGNLRTQATHVASGTTIITDAPIDNHGKGEAFSPTDIVSTALASCMLTIMGIASNTHNINIVGTTANVTKIMSADAPRRIAEIIVDVQFPTTVNYSAKEKQLLERAALTCPVSLSLHPEVKQTLQFRYE
jgi:putative redox protein